MLPNRHIKIAFVLLAACSLRCNATTVAVIVASDSIVIASDSKQRREDNVTGLGADPKTVSKNVVINDRVAVVILGVADVAINDRSGTIIYRFRSSDMLNGVKDSLAPNASFSMVESIVIDKTKRAMDGLSPYMVYGSIKYQVAAAQTMVYILAGYENGLPRIEKITVEYDWNNRKITGPSVESVYPLPNSPIGSHFQVFGSNQSLTTAFVSPYSPEGRAVVARYPGVLTGFRRLVDKTVPNSTEGFDIAADDVRFEMEFDPENVGAPINIVVLSNNCARRESTLPK